MISEVLEYLCNNEHRKSILMSLCLLQSVISMLCLMAYVELLM